MRLTTSLETQFPQLPVLILLGYSRISKDIFMFTLTTEVFIEVQLEKVWSSLGLFTGA